MGRRPCVSVRADNDDCSMKKEKRECEQSRKQNKVKDGAAPCKRTVRVSFVFLSMFCFLGLSLSLAYCKQRGKNYARRKKREVRLKMKKKTRMLLGKRPVLIEMQDLRSRIS